MEISIASGGIPPPAALNRAWLAHLNKGPGASIGQTELQKAVDFVCNQQIQFQNRSQNEGKGFPTTQNSFLINSCLDYSTEAEALNKLSSLSGTPFDLVNEPPIKLHLAGTTEKQWLLMVVHRQAVDAASLVALFHQIADVYNQLQQGATEAQLPIIAPTFPPEWETGVALEQDTKKSIEYWKQQLSGGTSQVLQPTVAKVHGTETTASVLVASVPFHLAPTTVLNLKDIALQSSVSLHSVLVTGLAVLLARLANEEDVCVGDLMSGRTGKASDHEENTIGCFENPVVLRMAVNFECSFLEVIQYNKGTLEDAVKHSCVPFDQVKAACGFDTTQPPFQVNFSHLDIQVPECFSAVQGSVIDPFCCDPGAALYDVDIEAMVDAAGELRGRLQYKTDRFDPGSMASLAGKYCRVLESAAKEPHQSVGTLPLLGIEDVKQLQGMCAGPHRPEYLNFPALHEAFSAIARKEPGRRCLVFEGAEMTYGQVDVASSVVARSLVGLGVGGGQAVGLMLSRSFELIIAVMGIMKAGGCYLPLDPAYPDDRLAIYLEDSSTKVLLTSKDLLPRASTLIAGGCKVIDVAQVISGGLGGDASKISLPRRTAPDAPAYIIFTSGSTGRPKGVMISHRGLSDLLPWLAENFQLTNEDVIMFSNTISFDAHVIQAFPALTVGATLVIAKPEGHLDPAYITGLMHEHRVTGMICTVPTLAKEYVKELQGVPYMGMKAWGVGGESLLLGIVKAMQEAFPNLQGPVNMYGPTEVTAVTVQHTFSRDANSVVIGRPDANVHTYIVDGNMNPVPVGTPGELLLSGPRLAIGYVGRPDLTAEKFIPNPCLKLMEGVFTKPMAQYYQKAYCTGDLVRYRPDGTIDFMGRIDRQVKITGVRIELGEVEAALEASPGVQNAIAAAILDPTGTKRLVGYVTPASVDPAAVSAHCRSLLIPAMVPSAVVVMDSFPLMPNGKIDTKALPEPAWQRGGSAAELTPEEEAKAIASMSELERAVAEGVRAVLGHPKVPPPNADLMLLGMTSLLAMRLINIINKDCRSTLRFEDVIIDPTVRGIAAVAAKQGAQVGGAPVDLIPRVYDGTTTVYPAAVPQKRMWLSDQFGVGELRIRVVYNISGVAIDAKRLAAALDAVSRRHVILRTRYAMADDGRLAQIVDLDAQIPFRVHVAPDRDAAQDAVHMFYEGDVMLDEDVPLRVLLAPYEGGNGAEQLLAVDIHHIAIDGWSVSFLLNEISIEYEAPGKRAGSETLPLQYMDVALAQDALVTEALHQKQLAYWRDRLCGEYEIKSLDMGDLKPGRDAIHPELIEIVPIDLSLSQQLRAIARATGCSLHSILMAALQTLVYWQSQQENFVIGTVVAGRVLPEAESIIGFFVNTIAIGFHTERGQSLGNLAKATHKSMLEAYRNSDISFTDVLAACRSPDDGPLIEVMFVMQADWVDGLAVRGATIEHLKLEGIDAMFPLLVEVTDMGEAQPIKAEFRYDGALFSQGRMSRMVHHFMCILDTLIAAPSTTVGAVPLLTSAEQETLLQFASGGDEPLIESMMAHEYVERHAEADPEKIAAWCGDESITYQELNARANQLAHYLQDRGVGPDSMVTILMGRCIEFLVAVLGVNKAGGGYIPLDEEYPESRLEYVLTDSNAPLLLTLIRLKDKAKMAPRGCRVLCVDGEEWEAGPGQCSKDGPPCPAQMHNLVYSIYTSGTTGNPKGTLLEHRNLAYHLQEHVKRYGLTSGDVFSFSVTISFDASIHEYWAALYSGGTLAIMPGKESMQPWDVYKKRGITFGFFPTAVWDVFANTVDWAEFPRLRIVETGGDLLRKGTPRGAPFTLYNAYGPTECTVAATSHATAVEEDMPTIGKPWANYRCYVVDPDLKMVPLGVVGELVIAGPIVGRGYHNQKEQTAAKFIKDSFSDAPNARMYRSGDLVRWRPDGALDFIGRMDQQVKIRGYRIEMGEVEVALRSQPEVDDCLVLAWKDPQKGNRKVLVAYAVSRKGCSLDAAAVKAYLSTKLPDYMVPTFIVLLPALPLTPNGKYDRKALPPPNTERPKVDTSTSPFDQTAGEEELDEVATSVVGIIRDVLGLGSAEPVAMSSDIFALGADSLQAAIVVSRIRKTQGVNLNMREVYEESTVGNICNLVRQQKAPQAGGGNGVGGGAKTRRLGTLLGISAPSVTWSAGKRLAVPLLQLVAILIVAIMFMGCLVPAYFILDYAAIEIHYYALLTAPAFFFAWGFTILIASLLAKWILIGRYRPGTHLIWSPYFFRWWIAHRIATLANAVLAPLAGTRFVSFYYRLMGANISLNTKIDTNNLTDFDLITVGEGTSIGRQVLVTGHVIEKGRLLLGRVVIGKICTVGMLSAIMPESYIDNNVTLGPLSLVAVGVTLPPDTSWEGSPARPSKTNLVRLSSLVQASASRQANRSDIGLKRYFAPWRHSKVRVQAPPVMVYLAQTLGVLLGILLMGLSFAPFLLPLYFAHKVTVVLTTLVLGFAYVGAHVIYMVLAVGVKWLILGRTVPGSYHIYSNYGLRFWLVTTCLDMPFSRNFVSLFSGTPLLAFTLRALGANLAPNVIVMDPSPLALPSVDQWEVAEGVVFGGNAVILGHWIQGDVLTIGPISIARDCFFGDGAVALPWTQAKQGSLVGTLTLVGPGKVLPPDSVWVGSPAICIDKGSQPEAALANTETAKSGAFSRVLTRQAVSGEGRRGSQYLVNRVHLEEHPSALVVASAGIVLQHSATLETLKSLKSSRSSRKPSIVIPAPISEAPGEVVLKGGTADLEAGGGEEKEEEGKTSELQQKTSAVIKLRQRMEARSARIKLEKASKVGSMRSSAVMGLEPASLAEELIKPQHEAHKENVFIKYGPIFIVIVIMPLWLFVTLVVPMICIEVTQQKVGIALTIGLMPVWIAMMGFIVIGLLTVFKYATIGRFRPASYPLDSGWMFFWWTALMNLQQFSGFLFLDFIMGTEWATWVMRLLGAKIGQDCYIDHFPTVEFDLLNIGDRTVISEGTSTIGHTLERGALNFLNISIGSDVTVGPLTHVLPASTIEDGAGIGALSLVMKGEICNEAAYFEGSPVACSGTWFDPSAEKGDKVAPDVVTELQSDARLSSSAVFLPVGGLPVKEGPPRAALLTGATGFVGAFLLKELLRNVEQVFCLVRGDSDDKALERIATNVKRHELATAEEWETTFKPRIVPLKGDLSLRHFGLGAARFQTLAKEVDVIFHNGALVHAGKQYPAMKPANVGGTLECLRLATMGEKAIPLQYVSTESIITTELDKLHGPDVKNKYGGKKIVLESYIQLDVTQLHSGYAQSKWVAETLVLEALQRGLPGSIYRLGRIGGSSTTGAYNEDDAWLLFLKGCIQMQCFPSDLDMAMDMIPADTTARTIVGLSQTPQALGKVFHVGNPDPTPLTVVLKVLRGLGYGFDLVPYQMWRERLVSTATENNALRALEEMYPEGEPPLPLPLMDCRRAGIRSSPLRQATLKLYVEKLISTGFLPSPPLDRK